MSETYDVTLPVLAAITQLPGSIFFRVNCGTFRTLDLKRIIKSTSIEGVADIIGGYRGIGIAMETKTISGKQEKTQRIFQRQWEKSGNLYFIIRSPQEALDALAEIKPL